MAEDRQQERDLVLNPFEYATILDCTKGNIQAYVGPMKVSLSDTDKPVKLVSGKFVTCSRDQAIQVFPPRQ